jgi:hypothetical protein
MTHFPITKALQCLVTHAALPIKPRKDEGTAFITAGHCSASLSFLAEKILASPR